LTDENDFMQDDQKNQNFNEILKVDIYLDY